MQSFFIGIGAVIGGFLPWILANWFNVAAVPGEGELIPFNLKLSFYIGAAVLLIAVLWTIFSTKEYSPAELEEFEKGEKIARGEVIKTAEAQSSELRALGTVNFYKPGIIWLAVGLVSTFILTRVNLEKELVCRHGRRFLFGLLQLFAGMMQSTGKGKNGLNSILTDLKRMPSTGAVDSVCSRLFNLSNT
ncbi:MAG: hypothetical protein MZU84_07085 [Sphingobacterium sp.]|nr:hypothetical protein [Sphingobacterium sp.]